MACGGRPPPLFIMGTGAPTGPPMFMGMLGFAFIVGRDADDGLRGGGDVGSTREDAVDGDGKRMDGIDAASDLSLEDEVAPKKDPYRRWCLWIAVWLANLMRTVAEACRGGNCATRMGTVREHG